ncbi:MTH1187 family thiamine-binding protein [Bacillus alkalicola]|uniref:MTH1187 family thiamine-binding protein n=2 Tax=Bacillales TaxID=1385 RepID=A0ABS6K032_9BACI|nr:MTH1187 family thiamine-binding protein [Bacillus alkalicola]
MVRGLSFQKGIFFVGKRYVSCSYNDNGVEKTWLKPLKPKVLLEVVKLLLFSMPLWFYLFFFGWILAIVGPSLLTAVGFTVPLSGLPAFTIIYFFYGTHFWFPREMRKYHGAEHKVFSYRGIVSIAKRKEIEEAAITNRYCSTNSILVFFVSVILLFIPILILQNGSLLPSLELATYLSVMMWPLLTYWINRTKLTVVHRLILAGSYWLQQYVTTLEPEKVHLNTAIRSYRRLALKEFPAKVRFNKPKKESKSMAIADVTVIPIGTGNTSVSPVVAEIHQLLKTTDKEIKYELTPMSTIIEGEISVLFDILKEIHEVPFKHGCHRVATNVRIDDRRDKASTMQGKLNAVQSKLGEE